MPVNGNSTIRLNNIFFESGKAELLNISKPELQRIVNVLKEQKELKVEIHGHTDNIGSTEENESLSRLRALAVKMLIVENGIENGRVTIQYHGESQHVEDNNTEAGRKANRRVEVRFVR